MEFIIAFFLTLVSAGSLYEANAYTFSEVGRTSIEIRPNDYLELEPGDQKITFKKEITKDNPLLLDPYVIFEGDGNQVWYGTSLDMCDINANDKTSWEYFAVKLFRDTIIPGRPKKKCPVKSQTYDTRDSVPYMKSDLNEELEYGDYSIHYMVESSEGKDVFSDLVYTFKLEESLQ